MQLFLKFVLGLSYLLIANPPNLVRQRGSYAWSGLRIWQEVQAADVGVLMSIPVENRQVIAKDLQNI